MMKHFKKATVLVLALLLVGLVACGGNDNDDADVQPTIGTGGVEAHDTDPVVTVEPEDNLVRTTHDMGGREIRIVCWWLYLGDATWTEPDPATAASYLTDRLWFDNARRVEEEFNVTFSNISMGHGAILPALTTGVMAGDPEGDLWLLYAPWMLSAIMGDLIQPVSNFASSDSDIFGRQVYVRPLTTFQGEIWNFGRAEYWAQGQGLAVNQDIIAAIGADNPVDLFNRGQWTWDAMREIMMLATRDTTGDGIVDQFGLSGSPGDFLQLAIASNGGLMVDPNTLTQNFDHPDVIEALNFSHDLLVNHGVWFYDPLTPTLSWSRNHFSFLEGRSAFFTISTWAVYYNTDDMHFVYSMVPFPEGPNSRGYVRSVGFEQGMTIPVGVQNPADAFLVYEELMKWSGDRYYLMQQGVLEYMRATWMTEEDIYRVVNDIGLNAISDLGVAISGYAGVLGYFVDSWLNEGMSVMQTIETFAPISQDRINAALN